MKLNIYFLVILVIFVGCKSENEKLLVGKWNALKLVECEEIIPIETSLVNLSFDADGRYTFNSTLKIHEEGAYYLQDKYLFTHDKLRKSAPENTVLIKLLTKDSLVLEMNQKGKEQWLTLIREKDNATAETQNASAIASKLKQANASILPSAPNMPDEAAPKDTLNSAFSTTTSPLEAVQNSALSATKSADKKTESAPIESKKETVKEEEKERSPYEKREAKREAEEEKRKKERAAYLKREAKRREEEADRKIARAEYLKREAARKKKK